MLTATLVSYYFYLGYLVNILKLVVGSRNEGVSNYVGEGVICGIQFSYFSVIMHPKTHCLG